MVLFDGLACEESAACKAAAVEGEAREGRVSGEQFLDTLFGGSLASTVTCSSCATASETREAFHCLSLELPALPPCLTAAASSPRQKKALPKEPAAKAAAAKNASAAARLNGKERKRAEKEARRNAKRERKPCAKAAKAAAAAATTTPSAEAHAAPAQAEHAAASDTAACSSSSSDEEATASAAGASDSAGDAQEAQEPEEEEVVVERDLDTLRAEAASSPSVVLLSGPPVAPADWLDFVDAQAGGRPQASPASDEDDDDDDESCEEAHQELRPAAAAAECARPSVLNCLRAFAAEEQLSGGCAYACEACGARAAAAKPARRRRSVQWAPEGQLESVRTIPAIEGTVSYYGLFGSPNGARTDEQAFSDEEEEAEATVCDDARPSDAPQQAAAAAAADLFARFDAVALSDPGDGVAAAGAAAREEDESQAAAPLVNARGEALLGVLALPNWVLAPCSADEETPTPDSDDDSQAASSSEPPQVTPAKAAPPRVLYRDAVKRLRLAATPRILILHLKRFRTDLRGRTSKLSGHVEFQETLQLAPFCADAQPSQLPASASSKCYRLAGLVEHSGGLHGGHYVAYVRREGGGDEACWHYASDRSVRVVSREEVFAAEAYLLFYTQVDE